MVAVLCFIITMLMHHSCGTEQMYYMVWSTSCNFGHGCVATVLCMSTAGVMLLYYACILQVCCCCIMHVYYKCDAAVLCMSTAGVLLLYYACILQVCCCCIMHVYCRCVAAVLCMSTAGSSSSSRTDHLAHF